MATRPQNHRTGNHPTTTSPRLASKDLARPPANPYSFRPWKYKAQNAFSLPCKPPSMSHSINDKRSLPPPICLRHLSTPPVKPSVNGLKKTASSSSLKGDAAQSSCVAPSDQHGAAVPGEVTHSKQSLKAFREDWAKLLHEGHRNRQTGLDILDNLISDPRVSILANSKYSYPSGGDPRRMPDLARLIQIDLDEINLQQTTVFDQQNCSVHIGDSTSMRAAVSKGSPIAFALPCAPMGSRTRPILQLEGFKFATFGRTSFGVSGTLFVEPPAIHGPVVLTQAVGQCVVIHWADVPENSKGPPGLGKDQRKLVEWALGQPHLAVQILHPGEHAIIHPHRPRFTIALGHQNSTFSATLCARLLPDTSAGHWSAASHRHAMPPSAIEPSQHSAHERAPKRARAD